MATDSSTFKCVVIAPTGRVLDVTVKSVIFPAHDGQRGILPNHTPMFCQLGLGLMEVQAKRSQQQTMPKPISLLIDGGFSLFASNFLTVIAYDAVMVENLTDEQLDNLLQKAQKRLTRRDIDPKQLVHERVKVSFLEKLIDIQKTGSNL